jgi:hypothetical protein
MKPLKPKCGCTKPVAKSHQVPAHSHCETLFSQTLTAHRLRSDLRLGFASERKISRLLSLRLHSVFIQFAIARAELIDCIERAGGESDPPPWFCKLLKEVKFWLRGVDLNPRSALIPRKLLTFQRAKMPKTATRANLSFSFLSVCLKRMNPDVRVHSQHNNRARDSQV